MVAKHNGDVIGSVALEIYGNAALLRSLAVAKFWQGKAVSSQLYERIVNYARKQGVSTLYLMTETIPAYFEKLGYSVISRDEFPEQLMSSVQFTKVCPKSAIAMRKKI
ncbi:GNAT family N-acetyltransferase [candidate division KSB1 bacterium]|nr:GNAT family N-acetyltransferase [candidate division KSB1 bacterium]